MGERVDAVKHSADEYSSSAQKYLSSHKDSNKGSNFISSVDNKLVSHCNISGVQVMLISISTY